MPDIDSVITRNGEITFNEAVDYFKNKVPVTSAVFYKLEDEYRDLAFTVSGYTRIQLLKKFQDELTVAIRDGETMETFRNRMNTFLEDKGYKGITPFQADNIFRTNTQTAYQVGHYKQMTEPAVMKARPFWIYDAVNDRHTRPSHLAMDGRVFPADSPVWDTWYPPNGFRCRCTVRTLSKREVERQGLKVESTAPEVARLEDGRVVNIMPDTNFGTNPAKAPYTPDLSGYPEPLVQAYKNLSKAANQP
jgi:SPP1 gp7 family putative phage head morphogenesis protein